MNERKQDREKYGKGPEAELTLLATRNCRMTTDIMLMFYRVQTPLPRRQEYTRYEHVKIACKKKEIMTVNCLAGPMTCVSKYMKLSWKYPTLHVFIKNMVMYSNYIKKKMQLGSQHTNSL